MKEFFYFWRNLFLNHDGAQIYLIRILHHHLFLILTGEMRFQKTVKFHLRQVHFHIFEIGLKNKPIHIAGIYTATNVHDACQAFKFLIQHNWRTINP